MNPDLREAYVFGHQKRDCEQSRQSGMMILIVGKLIRFAWLASLCYGEWMSISTEVKYPMTEGECNRESTALPARIKPVKDRQNKQLCVFYILLCNAVLNRLLLYTIF